MAWFDPERYRTLLAEELGVDLDKLLKWYEDEIVKTRGYFTTYYFGLKRLADLQAKFGYDDKSYTEMLFAPARVSLKSFEAFLALTEADRKRFLTQFPSMLAY